jgi:hypothetical protein
VKVNPLLETLYFQLRENHTFGTAGCDMGPEVGSKLIEQALLISLVPFANVKSPIRAESARIAILCLDLLTSWILK